MSEPEDKGKKEPDREKVWFCPSAQPSLEGSLVLGVVAHAEAEDRIVFLDRPAKVTTGTLLAFTGSPVQSTEVFRFAAPCQKQNCRNWKDSCRVAERLVQALPDASAELPPCRLRPVCLWFHQEGGAACVRCTQVLTNSEAMELALNAVPAASGTGPEDAAMEPELQDTAELTS